ncbi:MAG: hypothetical protein H6708_17510 [Kofleriaceae bacterium]|nr:hypothetical protein [Kofleriaceae bacterium]
MSRTLAPVSAAGTSLAAARVVAGDPDDIDGDTFATVALLRVVGDRLEVAERLPHPVYGAWMSDAGTMYCTCVDGFVAVGRDGAWTREAVGAPDEPPERIFGLPGDRPGAEVVFVASNRALHVRADGQWTAHPFPDDVDMAFGLHGLSPEAIYVCTAGEGLHRWNGHAFELVDMPFAEEPSGVIVTAPDDLLVTADDIRLRRDGAWSTLAHDGGAPTIAVAQLGGERFVGTRTGVLRLHGGGVELAPLGYCNLLAAVGDAVIASQSFEGTAVHVYQDGRWRSLALPAV